MTRLTYPKFLLNIVLVLEEGDTLTRDTIARTQLPDWISVIEVPEVGCLTTKPRAMNYAMDFCEGVSSAFGMPKTRPNPIKLNRL